MKKYLLIFALNIILSVFVSASEGDMGTGSRTQPTPTPTPAILEQNMTNSDIFYQVVISLANMIR